MMAMPKQPPSMLITTEALAEALARLFSPAPRFRLTAVVTLVPKQLVRLYIKLEILLPKLMELSSSVPNFMASRLMSQKPTDMAMLLITEGMPIAINVARVWLLRYVFIRIAESHIFLQGIMEGIFHYTLQINYTVIPWATVFSNTVCPGCLPHAAVGGRPFAGD